MGHAVDNEQLLLLSNVLAEQLGLHFPQPRWPDLMRGMDAAAREFKFKDTASCVRWLLTTPLNRNQVEILASHLTIGETYFFRDQQVFDALQLHVLPKLIESRRQSGRSLRIWSAGCASGEEAYSLAILLQSMIPDHKGWSITILGTDINPHALRKAGEGVYGEWSFRNAPPWLRTKYFRSAQGGRYEISPSVKEMVTFAYLNLAEDNYPTIASNTNAMDIIFCRNVTMYFETILANAVASKLCHALTEGGWLVFSPAEMSQLKLTQLVPANFSGAILHRKADQSIANSRNAELEVLARNIPRPTCQANVSHRKHSPATTGLVPKPDAPDTAASNPKPSYRQAQDLYQSGRYADAAAVTVKLLAQRKDDAESMMLMARIHANQGELTKAIDWCEQAIASDRLNPAGHFLRAAILEEQHQFEEATLSYKRALYLNQDFVLAHFALGNLYRRRNKPSEAAKHYEIALLLIGSHDQDELVPESDGMTAGRLKEIICRCMKLQDAEA